MFIDRARCVGSGSIPMVTDMTVPLPWLMETAVGTPGSRSPARLFRATPRSIHPAAGTSFGSQPAGGRQFMSPTTERIATLRTSRNAINIINQADLSGPLDRSVAVLGSLTDEAVG